jgi:hypothetical protein
VSKTRKTRKKKLKKSPSETMMPASTELSSAPATATVAVPGRGRGRVVPRKAATGTTVAPPPSAVVPSAGFPQPPEDAVAKRALLLGQAPWRARRSLRSGGGGSLPRYSSVADASSGALRRGEPAVLAGAGLSALRLGVAAGASSSSSTTTPGVTILTSAPGVDRFFELDQHKNADPRAYYHVAHPETSSTAAVGGNGNGNNLSEWLRRASTWTETRTLCRALLGAWEEEAVSPGEQTKISFRPNAPALREASRGGLLRPSAASPSASAASALSPSDLLDWPRALELLRAMAAPAGGGATSAAAGGGELWLEACNPSSSSSSSSSSAATAALLPMRAIPFARVIAQVSGHRRVVLVDPAHTYGDDGLDDAGMRPFPFAHPLEGYSSRGWEHGDGDEDEDDEGDSGGKPSSIRGRVAELAPGDALVIPAHWWAHQELLPPIRNQGSNSPSLLLHAALELRLSPAAPTALSPGALRSQAARLAEGVLAASLGAPAVARCLAALARGDGQQQQQGPPPPRSVRAYDRAVAAGEAFEMLVAACLAAPLAGITAAAKGPVGRLLRAEAEARALCAAMAAGGRLSGGGVGSAAVGVEGSTTQRWLIEEDAEAARFPTLFRHRLLGAREDWRRHAVPLLMLPSAAAGGALAASASASALLPRASS